MTRRDLLRSSLAGLAAVEALALAGCGSVAPRRAPARTPDETHDVYVLNGVLEAEQSAIAYYIAVVPLLAGLDRRAASRFLGQDVEHTGILGDLIKSAGGRPRRAEQAPVLGGATTRMAILAELRRLEEVQIGAYVHAIPLLSSAEMRQAMASLLANDAQHLAVIRADQGVAPLTGPFVATAP